MLTVGTRAGSVAGRGRRNVTENAKRIPGEEGLWVFLLGDMVMFTVIFATYLYYRGAEAEQFEIGRSTLDQSHGVINTLLLLVSSLLVVRGVRAIRMRNAAAGIWLFAGALACATGFLIMKVIDYSSIVRNDYISVGGNFYPYYFALTGLHLVHLLVGVGGLLYLLYQARRPERAADNRGAIEGAACYWHMVDLLWMVILPLLYLIK
ncbi:cytochrome c oxidase subunit 3 [Nocardia jinanensis]|uniref:Cytochrome aa3 subunit 3 n=1 Tax=Nocardia jinanensis TaxID=382504 RepID=A0A917RJ28_9NOCA|nr:cytochrome c oxidase subunit 3 [Nocardia jinanensis]GGL10164.1 cytochrome c oxidase subunit III [Nocardia jinanensis]